MSLQRYQFSLIQTVMVKLLLHMACRVESPLLEHQAYLNPGQSCCTAGHVVSWCWLWCGEDSIFATGIEYFTALPQLVRLSGASCHRSEWGNSVSKKDVPEYESTLPNQLDSNRVFGICPIHVSPLVQRIKTTIFTFLAHTSLLEMNFTREYATQESTG